MPSPLAEGLRQRILIDGPLSLSVFMAEALCHPEYGYYTTADRFGAAGDFITAPEISQMFGELIGLWYADFWQRLGQPSVVTLVELGPGRGTLMADALRAAAMLPAFRQALRVHLVEVSPVLRTMQAAALAAVGASGVWHEHFGQVPDPDGGPLFVIANEFFDALPIRQFQRTPSGWAERLIDITPEKPGFRFVLDPRKGAAAALVPPASRSEPPGSVVELRPQADGVIADLAARLRRCGGGALIFDYGYVGPAVGDTFQALRRHQPVDPLADPASADLTAHVDFGALASRAAAAGAHVHGPVPQGVFLERLGIRQRAERLARRATPGQKAVIDSALTRLTAPEQMGTLFKVLALSGNGEPPAGFAD